MIPLGQIKKPEIEVIICTAERSCFLLYTSCVLCCTPCTLYKFALLAKQKKKVMTPKGVQKLVINTRENVELED
jgi:hypothetical protein